MARHECDCDLQVEDFGYGFVAALCEKCGELVLLRRSQIWFRFRGVVHAVAAGWCAFSNNPAAPWAPFP
jgi:hypothetical protein